MYNMIKARELRGSQKKSNKLTKEEKLVIESLCNEFYNAIKSGVYEEINSLLTNCIETEHKCIRIKINHKTSLSVMADVFISQRIAKGLTSYLLIDYVKNKIIKELKGNGYYVRDIFNDGASYIEVYLSKVDGIGNSFIDFIGL